MDCALCGIRLNWWSRPGCSRDGMRLCGHCADIWGGLRHAIILELASSADESPELLTIHRAAVVRPGAEGATRQIIGNLVITTKVIGFVGLFDLNLEGVPLGDVFAFGFLYSMWRGAVLDSRNRQSLKETVERCDVLVSAGTAPTVLEAVREASTIEVLPKNALANIVRMSDDFPAPVVEEPSRRLWDVVLVPASEIRHASVTDQSISLITERETIQFGIGLASRENTVTRAQEVLETMARHVPPPA